MLNFRVVWMIGKEGKGARLRLMHLVLSFDAKYELRHGLYISFLLVLEFK